MTFPDDIPDSADARGSRSNQAYYKIWITFCAIGFLCTLLSSATEMVSALAVLFISLAAFQLLGIYAAIGSESYHWRVLKSLMAITLYFFALVTGFLPNLAMTGPWNFFKAIGPAIWIMAHLAFVTQTLLFALRLIRGWQFHAVEESRNAGFQITDLLVFTFTVALSFAVIDRFMPTLPRGLRPEESLMPSAYFLVYFFILHVISGIVPLVVVFRASTTESGCLGLFCGMIFLVIAYISLSSVIWVSMGSNWEWFLIVTSVAGGMAIITSAITATVFCILRERRFVLTSYKTK